MNLYCPCDEDRPFLHGSVPYILAANRVTELPDDVAAHALRKLGYLGVRAVRGDDDRDAIKASELAYTTYLTERAVDLGLLEGAPHPDTRTVLAALERRGLLDRRGAKGGKS